MNVLKDAVRPFSGIIGEKFQELNGQVRTGDDVMKTRAFDPIEGRWRTDHVVTPDGEISMMTAGKDFFIDQSINLIRQPDWKLSRFTGLCDKNGKEIYEGDITRVQSNLIYANGRKVGKDCISLHVIEWFEDQWCHRSIKNIENYPGVIGFLSRGIEVHSKYAEVIGSIFENPELLEDV